MPVTPPDACTLGPSRLDERLAEWQRVLAAAVGAERDGAQTVTVTFAGTDGVAELASLCASEVQCCSFFAFDLHIAAGEARLTVAVPPSDAGALALIVDLLPAALAAGLRSAG